MEIENYQIFNKLPISAMLLNNSGIIKKINHLCLDLLGISKEECIGKKTDLIFNKTEGLIENIRTNKFSNCLNTFFITNKKNNEEIKVQLSCLSDDTNKPVGFLCTLTTLQSKQNIINVEREKLKLEKLHDVAVLLASDMSRDTYFRIILETAEQILNFDLASIILKDGDELVLHMTTDSAKALRRTMSINEGIAGRTYRNQKSYLVKNVPQDNDALPTNPEYQSTISVPIQNVGVFQVHSTKLNDFTEEDKNFVELLISHLKQSLIRSEVRDDLARNEQKYRSVFENTGAATIIIEQDMTLSLVNKKFEELVCENRENIENKKKFTEYIHNSDLKKLMNFHVKRRESEFIPSQYEFTLIDKYKNKKNIMCFVAMIEGTQKSVASYVDITNKKQIENELKSSLDEKKILLKEIHHRVKNNMQLISSLLNLHKHNIEGKSSDNIFEDIIGRINSIALIHEKLYKSDRFNDINIKSYIEDIVNDLARGLLYNFTDIDVQINVQDILINLNKAVPLGLIINEVVTNSMKHAFKGEFNSNPKLSISFFNDKSNNFVLEIIDNGVGFDKKLLNMDLSFGLELVSILSRQLKSKYNYSINNGTVFKLIIPRR